MLEKKSGSALLVLLIIVAIIALVVFAKGGYIDKLRGGSETAPGSVKFKMDDMKEKVDVHNAVTNSVINNEEDGSVNFNNTVKDATSDLSVPASDSELNN